MAKPFAVSELLARVRAMLRRRSDFAPDSVSFGDITLDRATHELCRGEQSLRLTAKEYQMMEMLMEKPRAVVTTTALIEHIWGWDSEVETSIVWVYVSNLRKKIAALGGSVEIKAMRGSGYSLEVKTGK